MLESLLHLPNGTQNTGESPSSSQQQQQQPGVQSQPAYPPLGSPTTNQAVQGNQPQISQPNLSQTAPLVSQSIPNSNAATPQVETVGPAEFPVGRDETPSQEEDLFGDENTFNDINNVKSWNELYNLYAQGYKPQVTNQNQEIQTEPLENSFPQSFPQESYQNQVPANTETSFSNPTQQISQTPALQTVQNPAQQTVQNPAPQAVQYPSQQTIQNPVYSTQNAANYFPSTPMPPQVPQSVARPASIYVRPYPTPKPFEFPPPRTTTPTKRPRATTKHPTKSEAHGKPHNQQSFKPLLLRAGAPPDNKHEAQTSTGLGSSVRIKPVAGVDKDGHPKPWPFSLKIRVMPPQGGNYVMRIKGPLDTIGGRIPDISVIQGRSRPGVPNSNYNSNSYIPSIDGKLLAVPQTKVKYIPPLNRNYARPPELEKRPVVYLKVPKTHQKYIELTTKLPNIQRDMQKAPAHDMKGNNLSVRLPFNVSLANVLKHIYERMYDYYLNKKPLDIKHKVPATLNKEGHLIIDKHAYMGNILNGMVLPLTKALGLQNARDYRVGTQTTNKDVNSINNPNGRWGPLSRQIGVQNTRAQKPGTLTNNKEIRMVDIYNRNVLPFSKTLDMLNSRAVNSKPPQTSHIPNIYMGQNLFKIPSYPRKIPNFQLPFYFPRPVYQTFTGGQLRIRKPLITTYKRPLLSLKQVMANIRPINRIYEPPVKRIFNKLPVTHKQFLQPNRGVPRILGPSILGEQRNIPSRQETRVLLSQNVKPGHTFPVVTPHNVLPHHKIVQAFQNSALANAPIYQVSRPLIRQRLKPIQLNRPALSIRKEVPKSAPKLVMPHSLTSNLQKTVAASNYAPPTRVLKNRQNYLMMTPKQLGFKPFVPLQMPSIQRRIVGQQRKLANVPRPLVQVKAPSNQRSTENQQRIINLLRPLVPLKVPPIQKNTAEQQKSAASLPSVNVRPYQDKDNVNKLLNAVSLRQDIADKLRKQINEKIKQPTNNQLSVKVSNIPRHQTIVPLNRQTLKFSSLTPQTQILGKGSNREVIGLMASIKPLAKQIPLDAAQSQTRLNPLGDRLNAGLPPPRKNPNAPAINLKNQANQLTSKLYRNRSPDLSGPPNLIDKLQEIRTLGRNPKLPSVPGNEQSNSALLREFLSQTTAEKSINDWDKRKSGIPETEDNESYTDVVSRNKIPHKPLNVAFSSEDILKTRTHYLQHRLTQLKKKRNVTKRRKKRDSSTLILKRYKRT